MKCLGVNNMMFITFPEMVQGNKEIKMKKNLASVYNCFTYICTGVVKNSLREKYSSQELVEGHLGFHRNIIHFISYSLIR